jgi:4-amino-4-deoxy-L-arabinose transferase-like glycosyltransferase
LLGEWGALASVFLFTNNPPVLAHAGVATMDMAVGAGICTAYYTFWRWCEEPSFRRSAALGVGVALALLTKFSSVLLLPVGFIVIVCGAGDRFWSPDLSAEAPGGRQKAMVRPTWHTWLWIPIAFLLVWAAYRFSFGAVTEKVPILAGIPLPAPQLLDGLWQVHTHIEAGHTAFLLGRHSFHGWWYFFPVALAVKTPIALLVFAAIGAFAATRASRTPALHTAAILLVNLPTTLNIGVRYLMPLFPVLALTGGIGAVWLWKRARWAAVALGAWMLISSALAHPDYLAYFNEFAAAHPERVLVDSDLDWGQDMGRLARELRRRNVPYLHMACLYTGDDTRLGLPNWDGLEPYQHVTGWVAISYTMRENYGWKAAQDQGRDDMAFAWLDRYQPVAKVGQSILLYLIPKERGGEWRRVPF